MKPPKKEIINFLSLSPKKIVLSANFLSLPLTQCKNCQNLLIWFFIKNFVKSSFSQIITSKINSWKMLQSRVELLLFHTVCSVAFVYQSFRNSMKKQLLSKFSLFSGNEFFVVDWALLLGRVWLDNSPTFATRNFVIAPHFSTPFRFFPLDDNNGTAKTFLKTWNYFWSKLSFWYNWFHERRYLALSL